MNKLDYSRSVSDYKTTNIPFLGIECRAHNEVLVQHTPRLRGDRRDSLG